MQSTAHWPEQSLKICLTFCRVHDYRQPGAKFVGGLILQHLPCKERLSMIGMFSCLKETALGTHCQPPQPHMEPIKETEPGSYSRAQREDER